MFLFLFLFFFALLLYMLIFQIKELFQVKNGLTTSLLLFSFFENAKNLGRSNDAKRNKKRGWPKVLCKHRLARVLLPLFSIRMY